MKENDMRIFSDKFTTTVFIPLIFLWQQNVQADTLFQDISKQGITPHFTKHTDILSPAYQIQGFSFMPGAAVIDIDNDGYEDLYLANGIGFNDAIYKNIKGHGFKKLTDIAGTNNNQQTTGISVGDLNNDGYDDIYVGSGTTIGDGIESNDGLDRILISNGKSGGFTDITQLSGIHEPGFTTSVAMADYNNDSYLDIYVGRFIDFDFFNPAANRTNPTTISRLYRNNGDLTFTDVTVQAGLDTSINTWSVVWFDYDGDKLIDLFVGREQGPISVYRNLGNGKFDDRTNYSGDVKQVGAWMGLSVADFDNDGDFDLFATNISDLWGTTRDPELPSLLIPPPETWDNPRSTLFLNNGDLTFVDANKQMGLPNSIEFGWGTVTGDFNNDGWLDFYVAQNFSPVGVIGRERNGASPGRLYINTGIGTFSDASYISGTENFDRYGNYLDGRGVISTDYNNDGFLDLFLVNSPQFEEVFPFGKTTLKNTSEPKLFKNTGNKNNWIKLKLTGKGGSNRNAIGAVAEVYTPDGYQKHTIVGGGSAFSSSSKVIHIGLGSNEHANIVIHWPDGAVQEFKNIKSGHIKSIIQGRVDSDNHEY